VICPETPTGTKNSDFAENGAAAPTLQNKLPSPAHTGEILRLAMGPFSGGRTPQKGSKSNSPLTRNADSAPPPMLTQKGIFFILIIPKAALGFDLRQLSHT
jgi:hypothetical protein